MDRNAWPVLNGGQIQTLSWPSLPPRNTNNMKLINPKILIAVVLVVGSLVCAGIITTWRPDQWDTLWPYPPATFFIGLAVLFGGGDGQTGPAALLTIGIMFAAIGYYVSAV